MPCDNCNFSDHEVFRSQAQCDGKGCSLIERCNAAAGNLVTALRVSLSMPTDCVAPLGNGIDHCLRAAPCRGHGQAN